MASRMLSLSGTHLPTRSIKRLLDAFVAGCGFAIWAPVALAFMLAIRLEDGGPVFFSQERWGRGGTRFRLWKFRTMRVAGSETFAPVSGERDPRITRVGRVLRATGLDELPQIYNVLVGDMSFVGPRPLDPREADPSVPGFEERHLVRPGLTGLAQLHCRRDATPAEKFEHDVRYVRSWSLLQDLRIFLVSVRVMVRAGWDDREPKVRP